ncbi:RNA 3'-phosphate cyclase [Candidatus Woesearchaeota archaeon]|nr:RNA 3'-phosphate cyclase [Candidatus Woesearchaeota archaeon]
MIEIDGSHAEGGGSILRMSLALSIHTKQPFRITNIRRQRKKPGLNSQGLTSVILAKEICNAKVVGLKRGAYELEFYPGEISSKNVNVDIGSAGSIFLVIQSIFLPCILSGKKFSFNIKGGTDVAWSPGYDYFKEVFLPFFENQGRFECKLLKRGYYPKGRGEITLKIEGFKNLKLDPLILDKPGRLITIKGASNASKDLEELNFADEEANNVISQLTDFKVPINITRTYAEAESTGSGLLLYGIFEQEEGKIFRTGTYRVSPKMKETMSEEVVSEFKKLIEQDIPIDEFFADQVIPFLAITKGRIKTIPIDKHLSRHLESNIYVAEKFLNKKITTTKEGYITCN